MLTYELWKSMIGECRIPELYEVFVATFFSIMTIPIDIVLIPIEIVALMILKIIKKKRSELI